MKVLVFLTLVISLALAACAVEAPEDLGEAWCVLGGHGFTAGRFHVPRGLAFAGDRLWVVDRSGRVQAFSSGQSFLLEVEVMEGNKGFPLGLVGEDDGGFVLIDTHRGRLRWFDAGGGAGRVVTQPDVHDLPQRAARGPQGRLYVCEFGEGEANRIQVLSPEGRPLFSFGGYGREPGKLTRAMDVLIHEGEVFVADASDRILVYDLEGRFLREWGETGTDPGQLRYPYGLAWRDALLYVCEYANNRIQRFDASGRSQGVFGRPGSGEGAFKSPWAVVTGPDGRLWIADAGNHRIVILDPEAVRWEGGS